MAPLSRTESPRIDMNREQPPAPCSMLPNAGSSSPRGQRRVIFPGLHTDNTTGKLTPKSSEIIERAQEKSVWTAPDNASSHEGSKDDVRKPFGSPPEFPILSPLQELRRSRPPEFPAWSPGLAPTRQRLYGELGLDMPQMSLDTTTCEKPPPEPRVQPKHTVKAAPICLKPTTIGPNRSVSWPDTQRRGRIVRSHYNDGTVKAPAPSFLPSPRESREKPPSILRLSKREAKHPSCLRRRNSLPSVIPVDDESNSSNETLSSISSQASRQDSAFSESHAKSVSFDPRVWVTEYEQSSEDKEKCWFSPDELEHFRKQTIARLMAHNTQLLPTGTGFVVKRIGVSSKAVFAYESMSALAEDDDDETKVENAVKREIQHVLVVDPHNICHNLWKKDFTQMIPGVNVCTASSSEEALERIAKQRFDIVAVEERLNLCRRHSTETKPDLWKSSGSEFIKMLRENGSLEDDQHLFIGVSAHLAKDKPVVEKSGADFVWAKPPPQMDEILRDVLLKALLVKRGKQAEADKLFGGIMGSP